MPFYGIFALFFRKISGKEVLLIMKIMKKEMRIMKKRGNCESIKQLQKIVKIMEDYIGEFRKIWLYTRNGTRECCI